MITMTENVNTFPEPESRSRFQSQQSLPTIKDSKAASQIRVVNVIGAAILLVFVYNVIIAFTDLDHDFFDFDKP